jgi:predicted ester cyclase
MSKRLTFRLLVLAFIVLALANLISVAEVNNVGIHAGARELRVSEATLFAGNVLDVGTYHLAWETIAGTDRVEVRVLSGKRPLFTAEGRVITRDSMSPYDSIVSARNESGKWELTEIDFSGSRMAISLRNNTGESRESAPEARVPEGSPERNKVLVRHLYEDILNGRRPELLSRVVAEEYEDATGQRGPSAFTAPILTLLRAFPDVQWTIEDLLAEGNRVAVRWTWRGTHTGQFREFMASQKTVINQGIAIFYLQDDKILRAWLQTDRLGFLQEIGALSKDFGSARPPQGAR